MTSRNSAGKLRARRPLQSAGAVIAGFLAVAVLSIATDQFFHVLDVYPPWGEPMHAAHLNALALSYRIVYTILGGYIAARLAPHSPVGHALALGVIGLLPAIAGAIAMQDMGPAWFPISLILISVPCAWLGGVIHRAAGNLPQQQPDSSET